MWGFILFLAVIAGLIGYGWWWHNHGDGKRQREREAAAQAARAASVRARGWSYTEEATGDIKYRIHGKTEEGAAWEVFYDSDHRSSSSRPKLVFICESLRVAEDVWHINDRKSFDLMQKRVVKMLFTGVAKLVSALHDDTARKTRFFEKATAQPAGSQAFQARFVVVATDSRWKGLVTGEIERAILTWPAMTTSMTWPDNAFSANLDAKGLRVQLQADAPSLDVITQMIHLGQALAGQTSRLQRGMV